MYLLVVQIDFYLTCERQLIFFLQFKRGTGMLHIYNIVRHCVFTDCKKDPIFSFTNQCKHFPVPVQRKNY